ncbi:heavy metal-binding protein HIP-like [Mercenaria mercenaria]|uniref:heavy metal-binding protein HIP-like n=1 Tax=Mercenaria mercenaria TaxID=6596 RepID=UPI00234EA3F6|nr:heavy metal-binding protein HIP-like [Mercenaria mercenaria]
MNSKRGLLCIATIMLLVKVSESVPTSNTKDVAELKLLLNEERDRRAALETNVNNLQNIIYLIQSDMMKRFEMINGQIGKLVNGQNVAFYARLSKSYEDIKPWATIVFSDVETNTAGAYNSVNGEFSAPIAGTYVFYSNILSNPDKTIETSIQVNGANKMYLYSGGKYRGSGSNMAVVHLNTGDKVKMVKHGPWGQKPFYIHQSWSSFSGFLLRADAAALVPTASI